MPHPFRCHSLLLGFALLVGGCASKSITAFDGGRPVFDPLKYFSGHTHSWGIFETPRGQPKQILTTTTDGRLKADGLHFEQDLIMEGGKKSHRSWVIQQINAHHYDLTPK